MKILNYFKPFQAQRQNNEAQAAFQNQRPYGPHVRIALIPVVLGVFYIPETWLAPHWVNVIACVTFVVAAVTDALDGFLARRYEGWATRMGAFLDPIADKLVVSAALVALVGLDRLDMAVAMIIIGREITVTGIREWMAKIGESGRDKDDCTDDGYPLSSLERPDLRHRHCLDRDGAHLAGGGADDLFDVCLSFSRSSLL